MCNVILNKINQLSKAFNSFQKEFVTKHLLLLSSVDDEKLNLSKSCVTLNTCLSISLIGNDLEKTCILINVHDFYTEVFIEHFLYEETEEENIVMKALSGSYDIYCYYDDKQLFLGCRIQLKDIEISFNDPFTFKDRLLKMLGKPYNQYKELKVIKGHNFLVKDLHFQI